MIPEWLTPRVLFPFEGQQWQILFTHRVLLSCEQLTGVNMLSANLGNPSAGLIRALLFLALERAGAECSIDQVGGLITPGRLRAVRNTVLSAWAASMPMPDPGAKKGHKAEKQFTWLDAWAEATSRDGLGLPEEQWLDMTPRQTSALQKLHMDQMQREELLVGIMASTIANYGFCRPDKPRTAESFMIHPLPEAPLEPVTGEMIMAAMKKARGEK